MVFGVFYEKVPKKLKKVIWPKTCISAAHKKSNFHYSLHKNPHQLTWILIGVSWSASAGEILEISLEFCSREKAMPLVRVAACVCKFFLHVLHSSHNQQVRSPAFSPVLINHMKRIVQTCRNVCIESASRDSALDCTHMNTKSPFFPKRRTIRFQCHENADGRRKYNFE